ncbi:hypothetical protein FKR81_25305 [Lentzea tibetensis]|uniref:PH domain-containing protein n=1 Tax=Lentzea tibetensis TaxID=2591470 RepID=A0A563ENW6_9PSEU|nr:hypothetical protein [Lentzea tibetensis]TWP49000.1 hypothetical protein FKR81_25305 [Lentzea tibetensis]
MNADVPPGEYELWRGSPEEYKVLTWAEVRGIPGTLVGLGIAYVIWSIPWFPISPWLVLAFVVSLLIQMPIRPLVRWYRVATTSYLLTDKRILTTTRPFGFRRTRDSPLRLLKAPELRDETEDGFGTITFDGSGTPSFMLVGNRFVPTLRGIPDVRAVLAKIKDRLED